MKRLLYILMVVCVCCLTACTPEEDEIFGQTSAQRINEKMSEELAVLTAAPNGWLMEYYPSSAQSYGGYNVLVKFTEDGNATVAADIINSPAATSTSTFRLKEQAGPTLTFDTLNEIFHIFSDPNNSLGIGNVGLGMEGDYEFTIMSATAEEVVLRGKKTENTIVMTPMPEDVSWESYLTQIQQIEAASNQYSLYKITLDGVEYSIARTYRTLSVSHMEEDETVTETFSYIQTPDSWKFYSPLTLGDKTFDELVYDESTGCYGASDGAFVMENVVPPLNQAFVNGLWFVAYSQLGSYAQLYFDQVKDLYATDPNLTGEQLYFFAMGTEGGHFGAYFGSLASGGYYAGQLYYNYSLEGDDVIAMQFAVDGDNNGIFYHSVGFAYLLMPFGYSSPVTFKVTADNAGSPTTITLTDQNNPYNVITLTQEPVYFPFDN